MHRACHFYFKTYFLCYRYGDCIRFPEKGGKLAYEAYLESIYPINELQIICHGKIIDSVISRQGEKRLKLCGAIMVLESCWMAARCASRLQAQHTWSVNHVAAHTSPVYVQCGGNDIFDPSDAMYILTLIEGGLTWLDTLSILASPERHIALHQIFHTAHDSLSRRLQDHLYHGQGK